MMVAGPAVVGNGGHVFKQEADNLFATFENPTNALEAALDIFRGFQAVNGVVPSDRDIAGSVGIGYGPMLLVGEEDVFGCEMNVASKLGEDFAGASEILLTANAYASLPPDRYRFKPTSLTRSAASTSNATSSRPSCSRTAWKPRFKPHHSR